MTEEQNLPQAQSHEAATFEASTQQDPSSQGQPAAGQAKSRRRRRKRKGGKGGGAAQMQSGPQPTGQADAQQEALPFVQASAQESAAPAAQSLRQNSSGQGAQQNQQGPKQARKFRKKGRSGPSAARNENPGNQISANSGNGQGNGQGNGSGGQGAGRRRGKQRRAPQTFVGPMDHSYRAVNGNFSDSPPSTIEVHGNGHRGDNYGGNGNGYGYGSSSNGNGNGNGYSPESFAARASRQPHADAPARIVCFIDDLFFTAKIQETARKLGVKVVFAKAEKDTVAQLAGADEAARPGLIVFDLNNLNAKPLTLIPKLKAKLKKGTSIVGFLSHLQGDLKMKATEAGCDAVMPRSAFSQNLPNLLRRYGLVDEPEGVEQ